MNKRQIIASLNDIANELDSNGLIKEANEVTSVMKKISQTGISSSFGVSAPDSGMFGSGIGGNIPSGIDKSAVPSIPKPYAPLGPKNPADADTAQKWINMTSNLVDGDIMKVAQLAIDGLKSARDKNVAKKFNDAIHILKNHPRYKKQAYENHSDPLASY